MLVSPNFTPILATSVAKVPAIFVKFASALEIGWNSSSSFPNSSFNTLAVNSVSLPCLISNFCFRISSWANDAARFPFHFVRSRLLSTIRPAKALSAVTVVNHSPIIFA